MNSRSVLKYIGLPAVLVMAGFLFSCVNDLEKIQQVTYDSKAPEEVTSNLELIYTDSGYAQVRIQAAIAETYNTPEKIAKLKDGLEIEFYARNGSIVSTLSALYGEINYQTGIMFVRDSVILRNIERNQSLETEELHYNQKDSTIYTDHNVILRRNGKVGRGNGIRTTQSFNYYKVINPVGEAAFSEVNPDSQ
ncbi:LPS export ABC transporter periplasmic protein LptC [Crocinitomicaceae bacterium]|nr:LPS export ABC transporter periplasmic protein LptC [Crocinitomicaceae bacterium]